MARAHLKQALTGWSITAPLTEGGNVELRGGLDRHMSEAQREEVLGVVDALADGLKRAGFKPEVALHYSEVLIR